MTEQEYKKEKIQKETFIRNIVRVLGKSKEEALHFWYRTQGVLVFSCDDYLKDKDNPFFSVWAYGYDGAEVTDAMHMPSGVMLTSLAALEAPPILFT